MSCDSLTLSDPWFLEAEEDGIESYTWRARARAHRPSSKALNLRPINPIKSKWLCPKPPITYIVPRGLTSVSGCGDCGPGTFAEAGAAGLVAVILGSRISERVTGFL